MDIFSLEGKRAIVTGGAQGLGLAMAEAMAEGGASVAMIDVSEKVREAAASLDAGSGRIFGVVGNLMDREERKNVFEEAVGILGGSLDILINGAGIQRRGSVLNFDDKDWDDVLELDLNAVYSLCKYAGNYMVKQNYGKIINIASMNSYFGGTNAPAYASSKGAVVQLTKAIANEWSKFNVNANCIAPGFMETPMTKDMVEDKSVYEFKLGRIPKGRWGTPEDVKGVVRFLASDASDYICGVVIPVDGGYLCK